MNRTILAALLSLLVIAVGAQESGPPAPEETEIIIPELILQIEELELQQVTAVLPDAGDLALGRISIPLPGAAELLVDEAAFSIPQAGIAVPQDTTSIFSSGRLGAGTVNHIVGELSLFKLGADPRYRLRFAHEGLDGYQFREAGTGYFSSVNVIDGWFAGGNERITTDVEAEFSERVEGLQGESSYFSAGLRRTTGSAVFRFLPDPLVALSATADASVATRIQSASGSGPVPREQEFALRPELEARFTVRSVDIVLSSSYFLRYVPGGVVPVAQDVDLLTGVDIALPASATLSARAGVLWDPNVDLRYPWSLSLGLLLGDALEANLSGGYRVERLTLADIWEAVPLAGVGDAEGTPELINDAQWYGTISGRWSGPSGFAVTGGFEFVAHDSVVDLQDYDSVADEFPFVQRDMLSLIGRARASWRPGPQMQVQAGWTGAFIDATTGTPTASIDGGLRVGDATERLSASAEVRTDFFPEVSMPWLGLSGSFAPSDELEFTLELADLLAPLLGEVGRPSIGPIVGPSSPFIQPGFRASLFARISL